ncbi:MAG: hypothetical protein M1840_007001 [Geoglossum simile]|nr:MAG: hypothetical protein M1840_007001 [Geoglossum simile]
MTLDRDPNTVIELDPLEQANSLDSLSLASPQSLEDAPGPGPVNAAAAPVRPRLRRWIDNPLHPRTREEITQDARTFHNEKKLQHIVDVDPFIRAVLAAWHPDPKDIQRIPQLTEIERDGLLKEGDGTTWEQIKRLPRDFHIVLATCCFAAVAQGWDQSSINGANIGWYKEFGLKVDLANPQAHAHDIWIFGIVNASAYLSAAIAGSWISDPLTEFIYGRRGAIFVSGLFSFSAVIGAAYAQSWKSLLAWRVLLGIGMGAKASVVPVLLSEIAPRGIRGSLVISWQTLDALGVCLGFAANLVVYDSWRAMVAAAFIPPLLMLVLIPFCTESPRWLLKKAKYPEALKAWVSLYGGPTPILACRDFYYTHVQIQNETEYIRHADPVHDASASAAHGAYQEEFKTTSFPRRVAQLFTVPRIRRAAVSAFVIMIAQQACGVNILAFLSTTFFNDALSSAKAAEHSNQKKALWMSFGFGLANFLFSYPAWLWIDRRGRRFLLNISFPAMSVTLLIAGCSFLAKDQGVRQGLLIVFVLLFTLAYSVGEGPVAFVLSSEIFPLVNREVGMSWAVFWNLLGAGILALVVPILAHALTHTGVLGLFTGLNLVSWVAVFFLVPETAQEGLEVLNRKCLFTPKKQELGNTEKQILTRKLVEIPTMVHVRYRLEVLRWFFLRRISRPEALEDWAERRMNPPAPAG